VRVSRVFSAVSITLEGAKGVSSLDLRNPALLHPVQFVDRTRSCVDYVVTPRFPRVDRLAVLYSVAPRPVLRCSPLLLP